jgi:peptide/nickel transport system substrate-binding protein
MPRLHSEASRPCTRLCVAFAALLAMFACADSLAVTLRTSLSSDILGTDPAGRRDENTDAVLMHMFEGLVAYREDTSIGPLLAESWQTLDDGRVYRFRLRQGVKFHNGATLNADDVVWSLERYLAPATRWRCRPDLDGTNGVRVVSVKALDARDVEIVLDRPFPLFLKTLARTDCGATSVMHRDSLAPDGRWRAPIGTGPFRFSHRRPNQYVELTRYAQYSARNGPRDGNTGGKIAYVDAVRFVIIPDAAAAQAALVSGALDVLDGAPSNMLVGLRRRSDVRMSAHATMDNYALLFQTARPPLDNVQLRRAIAHTIDIPALAETAAHGAAYANPSAVPVSSPFHTAAHARQLAVDLPLARQLAKSSGYRGEPITLIATRRYPEMFDASILVQAMARKAGIQFRIEVVDWATQLDRYQRGAYQAMLFGYSSRLDPSFSYSAFIGKKDIEPRKVWDDDEARELLAESMSTEDRDLRQLAFDRLHARFLDQVPMLTLYNSSQVVAMRTCVDGFSGWPATQSRFWGVHQRCATKDSGS